MPKSKKSNKKNGKQESKPEGQWVHIEEESHPDSWEIVEDAASQDAAGRISDDDLIVILEGNCQQPGGLSLVTQATPLVPAKQFPEGQSLDALRTNSPDSELDRSSDFQIIEHSAESSSCESDLLLETEIMEAAKRSGSLKYSHIVQQIPPPATSLFSDVSVMDPRTTLGKGKNSSSTSSASSESNSRAETPIKAEVQHQIPKDQTEEKGTKPEDVEKAVSGPAVQDGQSKKGEEHDMQEFVVQKSKKQKRNKRKDKTTDSPKESPDRSDEKADPIETPPKVPQETVQKEYFETVNKNKKHRDLSTLSVLLAKDQTIEDLNVEEQQDDASASTETVQKLNIVPPRKQDPSKSLEVVPEAQVTDDAESVASTVTEETASVASTEESKDKATHNDEHPSPKGEKKISKSARRRKKMKEKMAKAIESFSNPELLIEKYEKSFGEEYTPISQVVEEKEKLDNSVTCPVCLELYHHPYMVKPCGHIFCESCLRKLTSKSCLQVPCPLCRKIIQSCLVDNELSYQITKSFPVKSAARNRTERKSNTKKNPLPGSEEPLDSKSTVNQMIRSARPKTVRGPKATFSQTIMQRVLLVFIGLISYVFTSCTIRAISYFDLTSNNSTSYIFMMILFCLYFYFVDKGIKKLQRLAES